ncbi:MAG TPA: cell division protein FtsZ [Flexilinea sp.]|nr:cell division protein FtsZ [Flexilinea sp.]HOR57000.1 cell division protein FtsZ [Flexilinea sp.]
MNNQTNNTNNEIVYNKPVIKVIGIGGGGGNAVSRMMDKDISGVEFIAANTDVQALKMNRAPKKILLGPNTSHGMGAGGNPENGEKAALESEAEIRQALAGADIVFLTAGMGGGTGSGAISVVAKIAREIGAVTISVVNTPFSFESGRRIANARNSLMKLAAYSDTLIAIPNDQLLKIVPKNLSLKESFEIADDVLRQGVLGLSQLLTSTGEINVDFSHIKNMLLNGGGSLLSIGYGKGEDKVSKAIYQALNHPLLENLSVENATGLIVNFTGNEDLSFSEVVEGLTSLQKLTNDRADIIPGQIVDNTMGDEVEVILIVTGIASIPLESLNTQAKIPIKKPETKPEPETVLFHFTPAEAEKRTDQEETKMQPEFSFHGQGIADIKQSETQKKADSGKINISPIGDATFDTLMSPLGLSGIDPSSVTFIKDNDEVDSKTDLDIPTFIRRKM